MLHTKIDQFDNIKVKLQTTPQIKTKLEFSDSVNSVVSLPKYVPVVDVDYNELKNRPMIKNVTLEGNKSFDELGLYDDPDLITLSNSDIDSILDSTI